MTLANCIRLLKHFENTNQKERAKEMKDHIDDKKKRVKALEIMEKNAKKT